MSLLAAGIIAGGSTLLSSGITALSQRRAREQQKRNRREARKERERTRRQMSEALAPVRGMARDAHEDSRVHRTESEVLQEAVMRDRVGDQVATAANQVDRMAMFHGDDGSGSVGANMGAIVEAGSRGEQTIAAQLAEKAERRRTASRGMAANLYGQIAEAKGGMHRLADRNYQQSLNNQMLMNQAHGQQWIDIIGGGMNLFNNAGGGEALASTLGG
jgi:hypothetical protein